MDNSLKGLHRHFDLPQVATVDAARPLQWLKFGLRDMIEAPAASLAYGALFAVMGYLILSFTADRPYLFTAAVSGFFLVAPILAAGLYEISRVLHRGGRRPSFAESLEGWRRNGESITYMGLLLALVGIAWERASAILFALFRQGEVANVESLARTMLGSTEQLPFLLAYLLVGGALALLVFALCAVSVPMMAGRDVDVVTAMMTSLKVVAHNVPAMALWAVLIVALMVVGFATAMIGMVVLLPIVGHATWHAYNETVL